jgi:hypothetical protein
MKFFTVAPALVATFYSHWNAVQARPDGSPICDLTGRSVRASHLRETGFTEGTLIDGGISVTIDGCELSPEETFEVPVFRPVVVTISRDTFFRGVLARFDVDQAIGLLEGETNLKISEPCEMAGVS